LALLNFLIPTDSPTRDSLIQDYFSTTTYSVGSQVINDQELSLSIQPVTQNPSGSRAYYSPDSEPTDTYQLGIGLAGQTATGGTFKLTVNVTTTGLTTLAYNITAAALQTPLSAAFVTEGKPAVTVTLISTGAYRVLANSNGAIATNFLVGDGTNLAPDGTSAFVIEEDLGSVSTPFQYLILLRQSPMAYCEPATALTAAGVTLTTTAAGSSTSDKIQRISYDAASTYDGTFKVTCSAGAKLPITSITVDAVAAIVTVVGNDFPNGSTVVIAGSNSTPTIDGSRVITVVDAAAGTFTVPVVTTVAGNIGTAQYTEDTTCGVVSVQTASGGLTSAAELGRILGNHPQIFYQDPSGIADNIIVTQSGQDYFVQFTGTLGNSTAPALTVTNIDLVAPEGVSGTLNLNTIPLNEYAFSVTTTTFDLLISVVRTRSSGEVRTILGPTAITIAKDILDPTSMVPPGLASYLTVAQGNTLYGRLAVANTWTDDNTFAAVQVDSLLSLGNLQAAGNIQAIGELDGATLSISAGALIQGGVSYSITETATDYTILLTDHFVGVTSTASARIMTLPSAVTAGQTRVIVVKDQSGGAAINNITVKSAAGTIDGVAAGTGVLISSNYGSLSFYSNGTNWFIY